MLAVYPKARTMPLNLGYLVGEHVYENLRPSEVVVRGVVHMHTMHYTAVVAKIRESEE